MDPALAAGFVAVGLLVGFTAGLVGIGGGVLMVPFLYFIYEGPGQAWGWLVPPALHATLAHATSLLVIVPTAIVGTVVYARAGLVSWPAALPVGVFSIPGGIAGAWLAVVIPGELLKMGFGVFLVASAVHLVMSRPARAAERPFRVSHRVTIPTGLLVGAFSALMGVGGGLVTLPLFLHVLGMPLRNVAATSLAVIVFAATAGTITYMVSGWSAAGLPPGSAGYVHVLAALPLMAGAVLGVPAGARVNQRMDVRTLRLMFALLLLVLGVRLVVQSVTVLR